MRDVLFKETDVQPFTKNNFAESLANKYTSAGFIKGKTNFIYVYKYLRYKLKVKTFLTEQKYVSRDFLDSYKGYFVQSFEQYPKYCKRLHFFSLECTGACILNELENPESDLIDNLIHNYQGFIVARPIPSSIFGLTVLKSINPDLGDLFGVRTYKTFLLGREKEIVTLAYQEQDKMTSACATASIWYVLNKLANHPRYYLKSPIEITKIAGINANNGVRLFPNKGLAPYQMRIVIQKSHLEFKVSSCTHENIKSSDITNIIYSYSHLGLPILLVTELSYKGKDKEYHSVAIVGTKKFKYVTNKQPSNEIYLKGDNATVFYAHDDQYGPFVEYEISGGSSGREINCPWSNQTIKKEGEIIKRTVEAQHIIVPLYSKIRVDYLAINGIITPLDKIFRVFFNKHKNLSKKRCSISWDIKLLMSQDYRANIRKDTKVPNPIRKNILSRLFPKYIWTATLHYGDTLIFDFIFDATSLNNSCFLEDIIEYHHEHPFFGEFLRIALYENIPFLMEQFARYDGQIWINRIFKLLQVNECVSKKVPKEDCNICKS